MVDRLLVEGAILDADGPRTGYARIEGGRIVEVGATGTAPKRAGTRRVRGIVVPSPVNAHTHLGDAISAREPPRVGLEEVVRPPHGLKFRLLAETPRPRKVAAMRRALARMEREGVRAVVDFREEGVDGVADLRAAARRSALRVVALGRPLARPLDFSEVDALLSAADGIGLSSQAEEGPDVRRALAAACRARGKRYALHASEATREPVDAYLDPRPDLLVHLTRATPDDLAAVAAAGVPVVACVRSNALWGRANDLARFVEADVRLLLGTDNAMLHAPSIWRELEFAYVAQRLAGRPVDPLVLFRAAFVEPWTWLGDPEQARLVPGGSAIPLVLRLPAEDPAYQVVTRATEHLILRPATGPAGAPR